MNTNWKKKSWLKIGAALCVALMLLSLAPVPVGAQSVRYWWQVTNEFGIPYPQGTAQCSVYGPGAVSESTATAHVFTSRQSPGTGTESPLLGNANGVFEFFWTDTTSVFDVTCWTRSGVRAVVPKLDVYTHRIQVNRQGVSRVSRFAFHNQGNQGQTATEIVIPQGGVIRDVIVNMTSWGRGVSSHLNIGFAGNHVVSTMIALVDGLNLSSHGIGWIRPHAVTALTGAGYPYAGNHRGAALSDYHQTLCLGGVCGSLTTGGVSKYVEKPYLVHLAGGLQVTYQMSGNPDAVTGHAFILWDQLHVGGNAWGSAE